jgi:hypothetical protein
MYVFTISQFNLGAVLAVRYGRSMSALTVFSESIKYFKDHFLLNARNTGLNFREDEIHWVLTIPAIWKDALQHSQYLFRGCRRRGCMVVELTTAYAISAYHH